MDIMQIPLRDLAIVFGVCAAAALTGAIGLLVVAARQIATIDIPRDADFFETLQSIPITVPLALDMLDFVFDSFSAPITWVILELLGLQSLQMITAFEGLIPGTQIIPTMTIAWIISRMIKDRRRPLREALHDYQLQSSEARYAQLRRRRSELLDQYRRQELPSSTMRRDTQDMIEGEYDEEEELYSSSPDDYQDIQP